MKKKLLFMAFAVLSICTASAQDSTHNATKKQVHKKTIHNNSTMSMDSVNEGKITTNPNGKMGSKSSVTKRKTTKSTTGSGSTDSAR
jgi:hypothetical protein